MSVDAYRKLGGIFVIRRNCVDYLRPASLGEALEIRTHISGLATAKAVRTSENVRGSDGALFARAETIWGYIDVATTRPARIPYGVREVFGFAPSVDQQQQQQP